MMKAFYYFQAMVDLGIAFIIAGLSIALEIDYWIPLLSFGVYLVVTHGKNIYDFLEILKKARQE